MHHWQRRAYLRFTRVRDQVECFLAPSTVLTLMAFFFSGVNVVSLSEGHKVKFDLQVQGDAFIVRQRSSRELIA